MEKGGRRTERGAGNAGKRNDEEAFFVLESFRPLNAKECSRRSEFNLLASKMAAGVKRGG